MKRRDSVTFIQHSETAIATANPDLVELGLDEIRLVQSTRDKLWEGVLGPNRPGLGPVAQGSLAEFLAQSFKGGMNTN